MILERTVSTPQIARENKIEKTSTTTTKRCNSERSVQETLFFNSSKESLMYDIKSCMLYFSNYARVERLELPTPGFGDQCSTN